MHDSKRQILITTPTLAFLESVLDARYEAVRLWEHTADASLAGIRVLTCLGHEELAPIIGRMPDLELVACYTTGYDGIDVEACRDRGIQVTHAPGAMADAVAEYALALTLASVRNIVFGSQIVLSDKWRPGNVRLGSSVKGLRMGIVGLGDIGRSLARISEALGMIVSWWGPRPKPKIHWARADSLASLVQETDVVAICARADDSNRHLISREILSLMGANHVLVNVARGQLVDEDALIEYLCAGKIGAAALDVFEIEPTPASRWRDVPNVIVTPHIGGATRQSVEKMTAMLLDNLDNFFRQAPLATPVP